jgi:DNA-directed RNA polymerase subunit beta
MTNKGTFIINGHEKILINHLQRSPGLYYLQKRNLNINSILSATLIPQEGA